MFLRLWKVGLYDNMVKYVGGDLMTGHKQTVAIFMKGIKNTKPLSYPAT